MTVVRFVVGSTGSGWILTSLPDGTEMYYNTNTDSYEWALSDDMDIDHSLLNNTEIQVSLVFTAQISSTLYIQATART